MPNTNSLFQPLEEVITRHLIPAITARQPPEDLERRILALPCREGGMGIINPTTLGSQYDSEFIVPKCSISSQGAGHCLRHSEGLPTSTCCWQFGRCPTIA